MWPYRTAEWSACSLPGDEKEKFVDKSRKLKLLGRANVNPYGKFAVRVSSALSAGVVAAAKPLRELRSRG